ncbi:MAG: PDDEXK nuclease domain-containing protein [Candidatus Firestonebacteria bacterium]
MKKRKNKNTGLLVVSVSNLKIIVEDIRGLIESTRGRVATIVNTELTLLYWRIGKRIQEEILKEKRAEYGAQIVITLSQQLVAEYGEGFSDKNLRHMVRFAEVFPDIQIVSALSRQLSWTHFRQIIYIDDSLVRDFYAEMCRIENWSTRTLAKKIDSMLFERTAISKRPEKLVKIELANLREEDKLTPDLIFRDPYFLDFLGLKGAYQEKDIETSILRELEAFILELGTGFSFVARQKRITIDKEDYYLDLLFYHRNLRRLIAIELKLGKFKAEYKGQMELYLRWIDKYERKVSEKHPLGLILCAGKSDEQIELLELGKSGIRVAQYLTELPPREILEKKLRQAIKIAREHFISGNRKVNKLEE